LKVKYKMKYFSSMKLITSRKSPRLEHSILFLRKAIKDAAESGNQRLPTVAQLACSAGVSSVTLCKALAVLENDGIITVSQRSGIMLKPEHINADFETFLYDEKKDNQPIPQWQAVRNRLFGDMVNGVLGADGLLPTLKELARRYGTSSSQIKRALYDLEGQGRLVRHKKTFAVKQVAPLRSHARLVVVAPSTSVVSKHFTRGAEFWRILERESVRRGLDLDIVDYPALLKEIASGDSTSSIRLPQRYAEAQGFMLIAQTVEAAILRSAVAALEKSYRPVAVFDEVGKTTIPSLVSQNPLMRLFIMSIGVGPGRMVGSYLLNLNHRRIAFFQAFKNDLWSRNRLRGIRETFEQAGVRNGIKVFGTDKFLDWYHIHEPEAGKEPFTSINPDFLRVQQKFNAQSRETDEALFIHAQPFLWSLKLEQFMEPFFERALQDSEITAWVGENDPAALLAQRYLQQHSVSVPDRISVIGFDDTLESFNSRLTSFDFNSPALVHAMLDHVLTARISKIRKNLGPLEIPGIIMQRQSSGMMIRR
jgi:DNA-binding transcriptional regulator YhcF (GntR family)